MKLLLVSIRKDGLQATLSLWGDDSVPILSVDPGMEEYAEKLNEAMDKLKEAK